MDVIRFDDAVLVPERTRMTGDPRPFEPTDPQGAAAPHPCRPPRSSTDGGRERQAAHSASGRRRGAGALAQDTLSLVIDGSGPKGDVLLVAELAGVMAAKRTSDLIPLCHPIALTDVSVEITPDRVAGVVRIRDGRPPWDPPGVEMEALTAAAVAP